MKTSKTKSEVSQEQTLFFTKNWGEIHEIVLGYNGGP